MRGKSLAWPVTARGERGERRDRLLLRATARDPCNHNSSDEWRRADDDYSIRFAHPVDIQPPHFAGGAAAALAAPAILRSPRSAAAATNLDFVIWNYAEDIVQDNINIFQGGQPGHHASS